jgi:hypothetical protein
MSEGDDERLFGKVRKDGPGRGIDFRTRQAGICFGI